MSTTKPVHYDQSNNTTEFYCTHRTQSIDSLHISHTVNKPKQLHSKYHFNTFDTHIVNPLKPVEYTTIQQPKPQFYATKAPIANNNRQPSATTRQPHTLQHTHHYYRIET